MLKRIVGKIWRVLPQFVRVMLIRTSQATFTISVGVVVFNENGEILLLDHVLRPASGWGIPGGFMNHVEQPHETAAREIFEETGLELEDLQMMWMRTLNRHIEVIFCAKGKGEATVKSREIRSCKWYKVEEMPTEMSKGQREIIKKVLSKIRN